MKFSKYLINLLILASAISVVWANEQTLTYDRIELTASARDEVENDVISVVFYAQREGSDTVALANEVNNAIQWAVEQAKSLPVVKVQTLDYVTSPRYQEQRLTGWLVRQSLRLESQNQETLSELMGTLQKRLALQSIDYTVSKEKRETVENDLIVKAIAAFKQRAKLVTQQFGRSEYRLVRLTVNTGFEAPQPQVRSVMLQEARGRDASSLTAPTLEVGTQTVQVDLNGIIELQVN